MRGSAGGDAFRWVISRQNKKPKLSALGCAEQVRATGGVRRRADKNVEENDGLKCFWKKTQSKGEWRGFLFSLKDKSNSNS